MRLSRPRWRQPRPAARRAQLVLFAKLYDVAPDGTKVLQNRLISPVRVGDVTKPVQRDLPGASCTASPTGHRIQLVVAASDVGVRRQHRCRSRSRS